MAHFSFEEQSAHPRHGSFTCLVDANSVEGSLDAFRGLVESLGKDPLLLQRGTRVYLDDLIRIKRVPEGGFVGHLVAREGSLSPSVSKSLPGLSRGCCESFSVAPDVPGEARAEIDPFVVVE
jgi:hypothetical protein